MWDSRSDFTTQPSASCGSGFMSRASSSTGGFRRSNSGLGRWRSMYHLEPDTPTRSFSPLRAELWTVQGERGFRQAVGVPWLQDTHERLNTKLYGLRTGKMTLGYNKTMARMLDMEQMFLSKTMAAFGQDVDELSHAYRSRQSREFQERVLKLENDLLHAKSSLENVSRDQLTPTIPGDPKKQEKDDLTTEVSILREALREAEARATILQEERNKALQDLQTSAEMQKMFINEMEEMKKRVSDATQGHSEVQNRLREANSKISHALLDKDVLSTQVLKLEDNVKELNKKLTDALSAEDDLNKEKKDLLHRIQDLEVLLNRITQDPKSSKMQQIFTNLEFPKETEQIKGDSKEINKKLRKEIEVVMQQLAVSQRQLQELKEKRNRNLAQITDLEEACSKVVREKEELLSKRSQGGHDDVNETKEGNCQHSTYTEDFELENQKLWNQCLCLEEKLIEKEKMLQLQEETYEKQNEMCILRIKELEGFVSHWTEKWQNIALTLQSTQDELEDLKKNHSTEQRNSESFLRSKFEACNLETGSEEVQTLDKATETDFSESSFTHEPPSDSTWNRNKSPQLWTQSSEVQRLKEKLAKAEREVSERKHDLRTMGRLREIERTEAQIRISALEHELKKDISEDCHEFERVWTDVSSPAPILGQQDECREKSDETQQLTFPVLHKHPYQRQKFSHSGGSNEEICTEERKNKTICPVNQEVEQQRRMVTEQLKSLFKERELKETGKSAEAQAAAQSGSSSPQNWTPTSLVAVADRRNWQQGSGLMQVLEEDEENSDWSG